MTRARRKQKQCKARSKHNIQKQFLKKINIEIKSPESLWLLDVRGLPWQKCHLKY
jgi:hypothetical protein